MCGHIWLLQRTKGPLVQVPGGLLARASGRLQAMRTTEPASSTVKSVRKNNKGPRRKLLVHLAMYWPLLLLRVRELEESERRNKQVRRRVRN